MLEQRRTGDERRVRTELLARDRRPPRRNSRDPVGHRSDSLRFAFSSNSNHLEDHHENRDPRNRPRCADPRRRIPPHRTRRRLRLAKPGDRTGLPAPVRTSAGAVVGADVVLNAVQGVDTLPLLESVGADNLDGTVLWDIANAANPDFSLAIPDDSLGRRIQEAFPGVKVVKAGNHVAAVVVADPSTFGSDDVVRFRRRHRGEGGRLRPATTSAGPARACSTWAASPNADTGQEHYLALFGTILQSSGRPTATSPSSRPHSGFRSGAVSGDRSATPAYKGRSPRRRADRRQPAPPCRGRRAACRRQWIVRTTAAKTATSLSLIPAYLGLAALSHCARSPRRT